MKKILFALTVVAACFLISCSGGGGGMSKKAKKNIDAVHAITKMFETKDFSKLGDYVAADGIDHAGEGGDIKGLENVKAALEKWANTMKDNHTEFKQELANDDWSMVRAIQTSTATADGMGMKAGETKSVDVIEVCAYDKDGKITEHWSFINVTDMMKDMMKMMPQQPMVDTTKHN
ncbi:MAG TPA: ester cyclase [Chitinophagaceae bacterium]|nr:ester cyclase [Chitinophagaceae bacterium]